MEGAALITGGARRIGRSIALSLAETGRSIALHYNSSGNDARKTAREIEKQGAACVLLRCNLADDEEVKNLLPRAVAAFPGLDLLVNNASVFEKGTIKETSLPVLDKQFSINFRAPFLLIQQFAHLRRRGHVINLLDSRVEHNDFSYAAYTLSKKALADLTAMAAVEFAPGIRVNAVAPGIILPPDGESPASLGRKAKNVPLKRKGSPADVADAVRFLIDNHYIAGQIIFVDGGENL